jgi:RNA polymerase sigma-70 factor (ECF subfamily)
VDQVELEDVLRRACRRDPQALGRLVDRFGPRVFGLLLRMTGSRDVAEDLMQETFLRIVRTIDQYEEAGRFEAWLFRIAANLARDRARRLGRRGEHVSWDALEDGALAAAARTMDHESPDRKLLADEAGAHLAACLARLTDSEREILLLRHYSELSFREIADMLGVPLGTALARAHRALQRLRSLYEGKG